MDRRKNLKKGHIIPGLKKRFPCRVPSMSMHNEHNAYIERLIVENQELKDEVARLDIDMMERTHELKERMDDMEKIHHTHKGRGK